MKKVEKGFAYFNFVMWIIIVGLMIWLYITGDIWEFPFKTIVVLLGLFCGSAALSIINTSFNDIKKK